jgi:hypothetical protein
VVVGELLNATLTRVSAEAAISTFGFLVVSDAWVLTGFGLSTEHAPTCASNASIAIPSYKIRFIEYLPSLFE